MFEIDNGLWPANSDKADQVSIRLRSQSPSPIPQLPLTPQGALTAEASLTPLEVQKLGEEVGRLTSAAPALKLVFTVLLTVDGNADDATVAALTQALAHMSRKLRIENY